MIKNFFYIPAALLLAFLFTCSSCTKRSNDLQISPKKKMMPTMEQTRQWEEIKKAVEQSKKVVVAKVNGVELTMYDLVKEMNAIALKFLADGQAATPETTAKIKEEALDGIIFKELAIQQAQREGISLGSEAVDNVIVKVKEQLVSGEAYKKYLDNHDMNEAGLRNSIERSRLFETITAKEIFDKIKIDDRTLKDRYQKERSSLIMKSSSPRQLSFEEAKPYLLREIKSEEGNKRMADWSKWLRARAKIEIMPER